MSKIVEEVEASNLNYADDFGSKKDLKSKPARRFAILTCMDARLDPAKFAGLVEGDAHVIRNAGGRASEDAVRSLLISYKLLDTKEWFVVHHTGCGMETVTDKEIDEIFDVPISYLLKDENIIWQELERDGIKFKSPSWSYNGFKIWGLTAMITAIFVNDYFDAGIKLDWKR